MIQKELGRVGCLKKGGKGRWGNGSVGVFKTFLIKTSQTSSYNRKLTVRQVLALFAGYVPGKKALACQPVSGGGKNSSSGFAICDLPARRLAWIRAQDRKILASLATKKERDAYVGSEKFIQALDGIILHYSDIVDPVNKKMEWLAPQGRLLEDIRDRMLARLKKLRRVIPDTADYWVINSNASCAKCMHLADFEKLKNRARLGSDPNLLKETQNSRDLSFKLDQVTFSMLRQEHHNILDWHREYRAFLNTGSSSRRRKAQTALAKLINNFEEMFKAPGTPKPEAKDLAATYFNKRNELCIKVKVAWP